MEYPVSGHEAVKQPAQQREHSNVGLHSQIRGTLEIGGQYHYTMETQCAVCIPAEDGGIDVYPAAQWVDMVQVAISETLNLPQRFINIVVRRLGGSYGGKTSCASHIACACALGCHLTRRPVRFVTSLESNMTVYGKRYACKSDYTVTIETQNGKIKALSNSFVEDAGCSSNESFIHLAAHSFHNCYGQHPDWLIKPSVLTTDAPSNTWCRAPFHTEGISMIETIMEHIGREIEKDPSQVRLINMPDDHPMKKVYPEFIKDVGKSKHIIILDRCSSG